MKANRPSALCLSRPLQVNQVLLPGAIERERTSYTGRSALPVTRVQFTVALAAAVDAKWISTQASPMSPTGSLGIAQLTKTVWLPTLSTVSGALRRWASSTGSGVSQIPLGRVQLERCA